MDEDRHRLLSIQRARKRQSRLNERSPLVGVESAGSRLYDGSPRSFIRGSVHRLRDLEAPEPPPPDEDPHVDSLSDDDSEDDYGSEISDGSAAGGSGPRGDALHGGFREKTMYVASVSRAMFECLAIVVFSSVAMGVNIFPETMSSQTTFGVAMVMLSSLVSQLAFTYTSGFGCAIGFQLAEIIPFLGQIIKGVTREMDEDEAADELPTVIFTFFLCSSTVALCHFVIGYFRLSRWTKYVPQHVLLGTLGGVGVAFFKDYLSVSTGVDEEEVGTLAGLESILTVELLPLWGSALGIYVVMRLLQRVDHRPFVMVVFLIVCTVAFYILLGLSGTSVESAREAGWLFPVNTIGHDVTGFGQSFRADQIHFAKVFSQMGTIVTLCMVAVLDLNVNVTFLDIETESDTELDQEFRSHAWANLFAALTLTIPNHLDMEKSSLRHESHAAAGRPFSVAFMLLLLLALFADGPDLCMAYLPRAVIGCLMLHFSIPLLVEVYIESRHHLSKVEYATAIIMPVVMTVWGFLDGILLGILLACVFFVIQYGEVKTVRTTFTGVETRSLEWRPSRQQEKLIKHGRQVFGMQLEGYLFFGSVAEILTRAKESVGTTPEIRYMLLDFRLTQGMDNTAVASFRKLRILLQKMDVALIFCSLKPATREALKAGHCLADTHGIPAEFPNMNEALHFCEVTILESERHSTDGRRRGNVNTGSLAGARTEGAGGSEDCAMILLVLGQQFPDHAPNLARLGRYLERRETRTGDVVFHQGEPSRALYILEKGRLSVTLKLPDGGTKTIESLSHGGTMVGEIGLFTNAVRGAALVCEEDAVFFELSKPTLERMQAEDTALAFSLRDLVLTYVSHRLTGVNQSLRVQAV